MPPPLASPPAPRAGSLGGLFSPAHRILSFAIFFSALLIAFEASAVSTALPVAARELHGIHLYGFTFSAFNTATLFALVLSGRWCDRRGPLAPLFAGITVFAAGLLIVGTAHGMVVFLAGRAVEGLGNGLANVAVFVLIRQAYPQRLHSTAFGALSSAWLLPSLVGPVICGAVTENFGWRWAFLVVPLVLPLPLTALKKARNRLSTPSSAEGGWPAARPLRDVVYAGMVAAGAGLLQYAGQRLDALALFPAAAGAMLLALPLRGLLPAGTFRAVRGLPALTLLRGVITGAFYAAQAFLPLMMAAYRGLSPTLAGLTLTGSGLSWAVAARLQARPRLASHRVLLLRAGSILMAMAIAGTVLTLLPAVPAWVAAAAWTLGGAGMGLFSTTSNVMAASLSGHRVFGTNAAALQLSTAVGTVALVGLAGVLFEGVGTAAPTVAGPPGGATSPTPFAVVLLLMSALSLSGAVLASRCHTKYHESPPS